jgi:hypothetical protein
MQLALLPECRVPAKDSQCYRLLIALQAGARLTVKLALEQHGVYALSQRCGELRREYGWPVQSRALKVGPRTTVAEYFLPQFAPK